MYPFGVWQDLVVSWRSKSREDPRPEYTRGLPHPETYADLAPNVACFATTRISRDGSPVGYMVHGLADGDEPARWQFFAGDETQAFVDDPENIRIFSLNTIANHDPSVIPYLTAPVGSVWVRDGQRFVREDDLSVAQDT